MVPHRPDSFPGTHGSPAAMTARAMASAVLTLPHPCLTRGAGSGNTVRLHRAAAGQGVIFTVAIDGPAAAGKGTLSRAVAAHFGFAHLDTGLLYRAVAAMGGDPVAAAHAVSPEDLARPGLRSLEAGQAASRLTKGFVHHHGNCCSI